MNPTLITPAPRTLSLHQVYHPFWRVTEQPPRIWRAVDVFIENNALMSTLDNPYLIRLHGCCRVHWRVLVLNFTSFGDHSYTKALDITFGRMQESTKSNQSCCITRFWAYITTFQSSANKVRILLAWKFNFESNTHDWFLKCFQPKVFLCWLMPFINLSLKWTSFPYP